MSDLERAIRAAKRDLAVTETATRRRIVLAYRQTVQRLRADLALVEAAIREFPPGTAWFDARGRFTREGELLFQDWRYRRLLAQATLEYQRWATASMQTLRAGQMQAVAGGAHLASELAGQMGVRFSARINTPALESLIAATDRGPVRDVLDGYGDHAAQVIERELTTGLAAGTSPREITRRIVRQIGGGGTEARLASLSRTELMRSFNGSLSASYQAMGDVLSGVRWTAAKSARTCPACLAQDGRIFPVDYKIQSHVNCRCVLSPVPKGVRIPYESGADWLARQPADVQRRVIGTDAGYAAYARGDVALSDFLGSRHDRVWGASVTVRPVRAVIGRAA